MRFKSIILLTMALVVSICIVSSRIAHSNTSSINQITLVPIMNKNGSDITACGIAGRVGTSDGDVVFTLTNEEADRSLMTKFSVTAPKNLNIQTADLITATTSTLKVFGNDFAKQASGLQQQETLTADQIGTMFRELLVTGFQFGLTTSDGRMVWETVGPAEPNVRSMYLMCSGDLYRQ